MMMVEDWMLENRCFNAKSLASEHGGKSGRVVRMFGVSMWLKLL